jgi:hypothetical protein
MATNAAIRNPRISWPVDTATITPRPAITAPNSGSVRRMGSSDHRVRVLREGGSTAGHRGLVP